MKCQTFACCSSIFVFLNSFHFASKSSIIDIMIMIIIMIITISTFMYMYLNHSSVNCILAEEYPISRSFNEQ